MARSHAGWRSCSSRAVEDILYLGSGEDPIEEALATALA
jgi:hypothetical protein